MTDFYKQGSQIGTLSNSLPDGSFLVFAKHYRDNPNKVKFIANFSHCSEVTNSIQKWFVDLCVSSVFNVEYTKSTATTATVIVSF